MTLHRIRRITRLIWDYAMVRIGRTSCALALAASLIVVSVANAAARCPDDQSGGREALRSGQVERLPEVAKRAGIPMDDIISAELCALGRGYRYHLKAWGPDGGLRELQLPAGSAATSRAEPDDAGPADRPARRPKPAASRLDP